MRRYMQSVIQGSMIDSQVQSGDESQPDEYRALMEALRNVVRAKIAEWDAMADLQELLESTATGATVTPEVVEFINQTAANFNAMTVGSISAQELDKMLVLTVSGELPHGVFASTSAGGQETAT